MNSEHVFGGLTIFTPNVFSDDRGSFEEIFNVSSFDKVFKQANHSYSKKGVIRGLHYQKEHPQGKLIHCVSGKIWDVAVDIRPESETYGKWFGIELSKENGKVFWIPRGFAHGFIALEDSEVIYLCDEIRHSNDEYGFMWDSCGIEYPETPKIISQRDSNHPRFIL